MRWHPDAIKALRRHLGFTQEEMGQHLGVLQETISEWETGDYRPRGASLKLLDRVAAEHRFTYQERTSDDETSRST